MRVSCEITVVPLCWVVRPFLASGGWWPGGCHVQWQASLVKWKIKVVGSLPPCKWLKTPAVDATEVGEGGNS